MPGRNYRDTAFRFGFNNREIDNEIEGVGNAIDFGSRIYDPRLGNWLSVDPLQKKYPGVSPYIFAGNNPTVFVDINGKWLGVTFFYFEQNVGVAVGYGAYYVTQTGLAYDKVGKTQFRTQTFLHVNNQNLSDGSSNPQLVLGAELNVLSGNIKQDWSSSTYLEAIGTSAVDFKSPLSLNTKGKISGPSQSRSYFEAIAVLL